MQPRPQKKRLAKLGAVTALAALSVALIGAGPYQARALVVAPQESATPAATASPSAAQTPNPNATTLPLDSSLLFVLDDTLSSRAQTGSFVRAHLRDPIMLGGKIIAPAGKDSWVLIHIMHAQAAQMGNQNGSVDISFDNFRLSGGQIVPLITPTSHIDPHTSAGANSTRTIADVTGDIFVPGYYLFSMLRKGSDVNLKPGTVIRARTGAALQLAPSGSVAVRTPPPIPVPQSTPHSNFEVAPMVTPPGITKPSPKPLPSPTPTAQPT